MQLVVSEQGNMPPNVGCAPAACDAAISHQSGGKRHSAYESLYAHPLVSEQLPSIGRADEALGRP
eukprot:scaffold45907_cov42-Tisochrysis_lutea.AAC.1